MSEFTEAVKRLAAMTGPCPDDRSQDFGIWMVNGVHTEFGYRRFQDQPHPACKGTGRVPLFPGLAEALDFEDNFPIQAALRGYITTMLIEQCKMDVLHPVPSSTFWWVTAAGVVDWSKHLELGTAVVLAAEQWAKQQDGAK